MEIFIKNIGKVQFVRSSRAKRITIRMRPFKGVSVTVPVGVSYEDAKKFVFEKQNWIKKNLIKIEQHEQQLTIFTANTEFKTLKHSLVINRWEKNTLSVQVDNGYINVKYPEDAPIESEQIQNGIRWGIERALGIEALEYLPVRTADLAKQLGFKYRNFKINNLKSRWGACSKDNSISLNLHLMRLPSRLIDYVIIHELCHTIQKNHSHNFWELMQKVLPNAKLLDKELKNYNTKIY